MQAVLSESRKVLNFMPRSSVGGRPLKGNERLSERLPPIYVTPTFQAQLQQFIEEEQVDFAELGRTALEAFIQSRGQEQAPPDELRITKLDDGLLAKIKRTAKQVLGRDDADIFGHMLLQRAVDMPAVSVKKLLLGDFEGMAALAKESPAKETSRENNNTTRRAA